MPKNVLPDAARVLPPAGQKVWMTAFNEALDRGLPEDEGSAFAWAAVKRAGYHKGSGGKWTKMIDSELYMDEDGESFNITVPLVKIDVKKRIVEGFATLDNVDEAGDVVDPDASMEAFSKWYGNIREMHQKKAVGKAIDFYPEVYTDEETGQTYNGIWVRARISKGAEDTWQKVLDGTLAGFSVGGGTQEKMRELAKDNDGNTRQVWRITKYRLTELSLVDSPCNRFATIQLVKSIDGAEGFEIDDTVDDMDEELDKEFGGASAGGASFGGGASSGASNVAGQLPGARLPVSKEEDEEIQEIAEVVESLESWREMAMEAQNDDLVIWITEILSRVRCKLDAKVDQIAYGYAKKIVEMQMELGAASEKELAYKSNDGGENDLKKEDSMSKTEDNDVTPESTELQNNEESDISKGEGFSEEDKGILRKLADFLKSDSTPVEEGGDLNKDEGVNMNEEELQKAMDEKTDSVKEEITKSIDEKFNGVGESLTKIADMLEKVATADKVEEIEKSFDEKLTSLTDRIEALETSGAVKKSGDDAGKTTGEENLEKSEDGGLWAESILPAFLAKR